MIRPDVLGLANRLLIVSVPLNILGVFVGDRLIVPSMVATAIAGVIALWVPVAAGRPPQALSDARWALWMVAFVALATLSLVLSPYLAAALEKGLTQIAGLLLALAAALGVTELVRGRAAELARLCRLVSIVMGAVAALGLLQWFAWNVVGAEDVLRFAFMNEIYGRILWRDPGMIGDLHRVNSILAEPAYLTRLLGIGCGLAAVRLGVAGRRAARALAGVVPVWTAVSILGCYLVSVSILGYVHLLLVLACCRFVGVRHSARTLAAGTAVAVVALGLGAGIALLLGEEFVEKLSTVTLIADPTNLSRLDEQVQSSLSALAVAVNLNLALDNLAASPLLGVGIGAHPESYRANVGELNEWLYGLNIDDAASLALRLISETGVAGLVAFVAGIIGLFRAGHLAVLGLADAPAVEHDRVLAIGVALLASWVGLVAIYFARTGLYFDAAFWLMAGLVASLPAVCRAQARAGSAGVAR